jgi:hypothetical protein
MTPSRIVGRQDCFRVADNTSASRSLSTLPRYRQLRITSVPAIRSELTERPYNHSPYTDIEATKRAPHVITSAQTIKLTAYQRNPFIRQIQNPQEASDPYPYHESCIPILTPASTPLILHKSRMRRRARTDPSGGRSVMSVPTGTIEIRGSSDGFR